MRPRMISFAALTYCGWPTTSAMRGRFSSLSFHWLASSTAAITAFTVFGFFCANSSVNASTFSGWSRQICCVVIAVKPMPWGARAIADAVAVHLADLHVGDHLGGRDRDQRDIAIGVDPTGPKPVARPHRVGAGRVGHRER